MRAAILSELNKLEQQQQLRTLKDIQTSAAGNEVVINGAKVTAFSSNDYLGLSRHPLVINAACEAAKAFGTGSTASRHISGNHSLYDQLENMIAGYKATERSVVFSSGYLANLGALATLSALKVNFHIDKLCHASIIDGCKLSGAEFFRFRHNDLEHLKDNLKKHDNGRRNAIITESLFSMDGDLAPIEDMRQIAKDTGSILIVDCAHSTGVFPVVAGSSDIEVGTLSKSLGSLGGFIASTNEFTDLLISKSRTLIYTTALPPAALASAIAALTIIQNGEKMQAKLSTNVKLVRQLLTANDFDIIGHPQSPIIPILLGDSSKAVELSNRLLKMGIFIPAIRPPSVPPGKARLRLTVNALHYEAQINEMVSKLKKARR